MFNAITIHLIQLEDNYSDYLKQISDFQVEKIVISFENMQTADNIERRLSWLTELLNSAQNNITEVQFYFPTFNLNCFYTSNYCNDFLNKNTKLQGVELITNNSYFKLYFNLLIQTANQNIEELTAEFLENTISPESALYFLLNFLKAQFPQFKIDHAYFSQVKTICNFFTCQDDPIHDVAKALRKLGINRNVNFAEVNQALKDIIEEHDNKFDNEEFVSLIKCSKVFDKIFSSYVPHSNDYPLNF